ncbi:DUF1934 domain-containing protein [Romboutsia sedimentorum]|uniref:DUF1934 domain-containing protein n=1 Tax=Romboutsia sedimentorum TaxID=1368474 RepID=A0ABT7EBW9_9FIRM|nr:DUF1934 domain-containing protein [Romboutsia sedimentorum]MDK2564436.1 DUF1934 domain-containing protein [Romboutsia sedimentorum]MDK2586557.1 DUF1934 domain-containing protein [Romboutsia sedimentorum]
MNGKVSITTKQYDESGKVDTINLSTFADVYYKNNDIYVVYKENEDGNKTTSTIKISENEINIKRFGDTNSTMNFKKSSIYETKYRTPQGLFIIETNTKELKIDKNKKKCIKAEIEYDIKIMELFKGRNKINIIVQINE